MVRAVVGAGNERQVVMKVVRKQFVCEAVQFEDTPESMLAIQELLGDETVTITWDRGAAQFLVPTPEGVQRVDVGSWVVRMAPGVYRGLPDDVFQANFEVMGLQAGMPASQEEQAGMPASQAEGQAGMPASPAKKGGK